MVSMMVNISVILNSNKQRTFFFFFFFGGGIGFMPQYFLPCHCRKTHSAGGGGGEGRVVGHIILITQKNPSYITILMVAVWSYMETSDKQKKGVKGLLCPQFGASPQNLAGFCPNNDTWKISKGVHDPPPPPPTSYAYARNVIWVVFSFLRLQLLGWCHHFTQHASQ